MDVDGVAAAMAYVDSTARTSDFDRKCRELEGEFKHEAKMAENGITTFLNVKSAATLSDGRIVRFKGKKRTSAINADRIRAAVAAVSPSEAATCGGVGKAALMLLREQCTTVEDRVEITKSEADLPASAYPLQPAPSAIERMCAKKETAERSLKEVRKHKKQQKTTAAATIAALERKVQSSYEAATGCAMPPAKRPRTDAHAPPPPPVTLAPPPEVTRPGADAPTKLPMLDSGGGSDFGKSALPPDVQAALASAPAAAAPDKIVTHVPGLTGEVKVNVKETHSKGRVPTLKQFGPKLEKLLAVDYDAFDADRDDYADRAVALFDEIRASTAETRSKLLIQRK